MSTVTIGRAYFDALLQRAQLHTSRHEFELAPDLLDNVIISRSEHEHLQQEARRLALLKSALFRGGLTTDALNTLLAGESEATPADTSGYQCGSNEAFTKSKARPVTLRAPHEDHSPLDSDDTETVSDCIDLVRPPPLHRAYRDVSIGPVVNNTSEPGSRYSVGFGCRERIPTYDQRTVLVTNLTERTTHKDIAGVIRGGRLLDIFLRSDRSATVSFIEGAAEFLEYVKRNDIYLHAKRLEFRWADRQFHVPQHVSNKIAGGATRNFVMRGLAGKVTEEQIRDHLDHIHNLVVVDIYFQGRDVYISTNSVHNALFARTCLMSRTIYKGTRFDWTLDECAAPLPRPATKARPLRMPASAVQLSTTNTYAILDTSSEVNSELQSETYLSEGIYIDHGEWNDVAVVA
ncbi:hypothetical protein G6514_008431 [Epicoccum nigrum]|nr:hypothetical protein G6514_008431 [Epicoccum nigrum]